MKTWILDKLLITAIYIGVILIYPFIWILKKLFPRGGWGD